MAAATHAGAQVVDATASELVLPMTRPMRVAAPAGIPGPFQPRGGTTLYDRTTLGGFTVASGLGGISGTGTQADVLMDDVNIPATRLQVGSPAITTQMISVCQVQVGVHIKAGALAGNVKLWWTPLDINPATLGTNEIDTPPVLIGSVPTLANSGTTSVFTVLTLGDGINPIAGMEHVPLNMGFAYTNAGGGSFAIGISDQDVATGPTVMLGWRAGTGPDLSFNYYWRYDTDLTPVERGPFGLAAPNNGSYYIKVLGHPVDAVNPVGCCVPGTAASVCFVADGAANCAKSGGTALSLTGVTACDANPCNTVVCCNNNTGVCTVIAGSTTCPGTQVAQTGTSCTGITCTQDPAPGNDECAAAIPGSIYELTVPGNPSRTNQSLVSATVSAGYTTGIGTCTFSTTDVWYLVTLTPAQSTQQFQVTATPQATAGAYTQQPLAIAVYDGGSTPGFPACPGGPGSELVCVDFANPNHAIFTGTGSTYYLVRVAYFTPATTKFDILLQAVQTIACCNPSNGACVISNNVGQCVSQPGYTVAAPGGATVCTPNPCPSGACCNGPSCFITGPGGTASCPAAGYKGDGTTCSATTPPCVGACCDTVNFACTMTTVADCTGGTVTLGTSCATVGICPVTPPNDQCTSAVALSLGTPVTGHIGTATGSDITSCSTSSIDVWYSYTPAATNNYSIKITPNTPSDFGVALAYFTGSCEPVTDSNLACLGRPANGLTSELVVSLVAGTTYLIRAGGFPGDNSTFSIVVTQPAGLGACCGIGANCLVVASAANCTSPAVYQGVNSTCAAPATQCPPGACCFPLSGTCNVTLQSFCTSVSGVWNGADTACLATNCVTNVPTNDDCASALTITSPTYSSNVGTEGASNEGLPAGTCNSAAMQTVGANNSIWYTFTAPAAGVLNVQLNNWGTYDMIMSVYTGTCAALTQIGCFDEPEPFNVNVTLGAGTTVKIMVAQYDAVGGGWNSLTASFAANGQCCITGACTVTTQAACTGTWTTGGTCTPNPCPPAGGVCCRGSTCNTTFTTAGACAAAVDTVAPVTVLSKFVSTSTTCNTPVTTPGTLGNTISPCCYANYNHNATLEVQDIFDFLNDWFAGKKAAIVGGDGTTGTLQVQNIFDFLNSWFSGGCS